MITEEDTISAKPQKWIWFLAGFLGWFLVNTLIYALLNLPDPQNRALNSGGGVVIWLLILLANIILTTVLATLKKTRTIALGIISALAMNFLIATMFLTSTDAICFIPVTYPVYNKNTRTVPVSQTPRPAPTKGNTRPIGFHDGNSGQVNRGNCTAFGWTTDPDDRKIDLKVRVLSDGKEIATTTASIYRPDLNVPEGCPGGTCGYLFKLGSLISADKPHFIQVQAQDAQTEEWVSLNNSPKKLTCTK